MMHRRAPLLGDRLIPSRRTTDFEAAHHMMMNGGQAGRNVLSYGTVASVLSPATCGARFSARQGKRIRSIQKTTGPIIFGRRDLSNTYLEQVEWSSVDTVAFDVGKNMIMADSSNRKFSLMPNGMDLCYEPHRISSFKFSEDGCHIGVGYSFGTVEIWDYQQRRSLRAISGSYASVSSLVFNGNIVTTGSCDGRIFHHDLRIEESHISTLKVSRNLDVCSLQWSADRRRLASSTSDSLVHVWEGFGGGQTTRTTPLYALNQHKGAVKGLSWCPWKKNVLATGGADCTVKFWNASNGECVNTLDTNSAVSGIVWNTEYSELLTSHDNHKLQLWKYPSLHKLGELTGHNGRINNIAISPSGTTVFSSSADRTVRMWKCFPTEKPVKRISAKLRPRSVVDLCSFR